MKNLIIFILIISFVACKSTSTTTDKYTKTKDSISTVSEINYVQQKLDYTSEFEILEAKAFKQSFSNQGVTTTIEKDSASNKLRITNKVEADTVLTLKDRKDYFNSVEISDKKEDTKVYTPNKFNWWIPLILGAIIVLLIASKKFDLLKLGTNLVKRIFKI